MKAFKTFVGGILAGISIAIGGTVFLSLSGRDDADAICEGLKRVLNGDNRMLYEYEASVISADSVWKGITYTSSIPRKPVPSWVTEVVIFVAWPEVTSPGDSSDSARDDMIPY